MNEKTCSLCSKTFSRSSNLKMHHKKFHLDEFPTLYPKKVYNYNCDICNKKFSYLKNLTFHKKSHSQEKADNSQHGLVKVKCPLCKQSNENILDHFKLHDIQIEAENLNFASKEEFKTWKYQLEKNNKQSFVKRRGDTVIKKNNSIRSLYICHRSGTYISKGKGLRHLKTQNSKKIGGFCPAKIEVINKNGKCSVIYTRTHVGHDDSLGHLCLTSIERQNLAEKIAAKIPFDNILDEVRGSINGSDLERIHILTKKDLYNIEQQYNLNDLSVRHKSVDAWVKEMQETTDCVLFYKPQDTQSCEYPNLKQEDFALIIMNEAQINIIKRYGEDCICIDGTHGLNSYGFELYTILVLDDIREGFPAAFLISNRSDHEIMTIFFSSIKHKLGMEIKPKVFMSDMADCFYNAWIQVMQPAEFRLYCSWHVDRAWRKNLNKISSKEQQVVIYRELRTLMQETDVTAFTSMIDLFINNLLADTDTTEFGKYFQSQYANKVTSWAYAYRLHSGLNTNMHIERMHKTIKYIYLNGKNIKRLDKAIHAILRFVRDKMFDRLISLNKGKLSSKLTELRKRHKSSIDLDLDMVVARDSAWEVLSSTNQEIYIVVEVNKQCTCNLRCVECNSCLHNFLCTCIDSAIRWNMCKHIHLVCRYKKSLTMKTDGLGTQLNNFKDEQKLVIEDCSIGPNDEIAEITQLLSKPDLKPNHFEDQKKQYIESVLQTLQGLSNIEELEACRKLTAPIPPTIAALRSQTQITNIPTILSETKVPHNKNIVPQRRLYSTKKSKRVKKMPALNLTQTDINLIGIKLLHQ